MAQTSLHGLRDLGTLYEHFALSCWQRFGGKREWFGFLNINSNEILAKYVSFWF